jgi:hypothetical protein
MPFRGRVPLLLKGTFDRLLGRPVVIFSVKGIYFDTGLGFG